MLVCPLCPGRSFLDDLALQQHRASRKHKHAVLCPHCNQGLKSQQALQQHINDKHLIMMYTHNPTFTMPVGTGLPARQDTKFKCKYCNLVFGTKQARKTHQRTHRRPCHHCERKFYTEPARLQHEASKHASMHNFKCTFCHLVFSNVDLLRSHEQQHHLIKCRYCATGFNTQYSKNAHEQSCVFNPATMVKHPIMPPDYPALRPSSSSLNEYNMMEMDREPSTAVIAPQIDEMSESSASSSSNSILDEGEVFRVTDGVTSGTVGNEVMIEESSAHIGIPILDDNTDDGVCSDDPHQGHLADSQNVVFRCTACLDFFSEQAYRDHICAYRTATFKPHCPVCYSRFDDQSLLQSHLEGSEAFSCQLCQIRCCSEEMKQDHLLSHPTCPKCGETFADNLTLCGHVESDHPVVVCWDCDGTVVERDDLELHYAESPAHPSCVICGVGTRNSDGMDEHVRNLHSSVAAMPNHPGSSDVNASPDKEPPSEDKPPREVQNAAGLPSDQPGSALLEAIASLSGPCEGAHNSPSRTESTLFLSPHLGTPAQVEQASEPARYSNIVNEEQSLDRMDVDTRHYLTPSPTPSEHGSDVSRVQVHATGVTNAATNNDTRASSPVLTASVDSSFSDTGRTTSSHSVVFVSADGIPDYIRENRTVLVATSAGSPSSGRTPLRLPSTSSLESLDMVERIRRVQARSDERSTGVESTARPTHRLHCRICLKDPCEDMTATICGHVFCKRCITQAIVAKSECPVCKSATLLYCLFKLDLSV